MQNSRRIAKITLCISPSEQTNTVDVFTAVLKDKLYFVQTTKQRINVDDIGKIKQLKTDNQFHFEFVCYCFENEFQHKYNCIFETLKSKVEPLIDNFLSFRFNYNLLTSKQATPCRTQ